MVMHTVALGGRDPDKPHITPEEAAYHPDRNRITGSIGMPTFAYSSLR